jgi:hypothetical protein
MTEGIGLNAKTIHRLLEINPRTGGFKASRPSGAYRARAGVATLGVVLRVVALSGYERLSRLSHELTFPKFFLEKFSMGLFTPALSHARWHATVDNEHLTGNGFGSAKC